MISSGNISFKPEVNTIDLILRFSSDKADLV